MQFQVCSCVPPNLKCPRAILIGPKMRERPDPSISKRLNFVVHVDPQTLSFLLFYYISHSGYLPF